MPDARSPLRLMTWNLCGGGRGTPAGDTLDLMADVIADAAPDVLCCTETAGATERLVRRCREAGRADYRGYRLAVRGTDDNLSIITRLPVHARLTCSPGRTVDSYNLGGLRLGLPGGGAVAVFGVWLRFDVGIVEALETTAEECATGRERTRTDEELALLEMPQLVNIEEILSEHLPVMVPDDAVPVVLAGGFNTESHLDADGVDLPYQPNWQVTRQLAKAGFVDAYRTAHPGPGERPGSTYNPLLADQRLPHRIDYVFAGGQGIEVLDARVLDRRLAQHGPGPFYSDHAALLVDLRVPDGAAAADDG